MSTVASVLTELVAAARDAAGFADSPVPLEPALPTQNPAHGDYQSNFAFRLGKALRTNPRAVAEQIKAALLAHPMLASAEVAGPGFLNFKLDDAWLGAEVARRGAMDRFDAAQPGAGKAMVIDYSSPNIAKRMHVGHMRSTIIGNALDRMHRFLGWSVVADNHIGDWGTQFGKLIVAWHRWRDDANYAADPIGELQRIYQLFGTKAAEDAELMELARAETAKLQAGDPANRALWEAFVAVSMTEFDRVYERLDIRFDETLGESAYRDGLSQLVADLKQRGIAMDSDGAVIISFDASDGKGLSKSPMLIQKRDGAALYGTTDIATVNHRIEQWDPDRIVYVTDVRQQLHFRQLFAAVRKLGVERDLRHVWFGMLKFADGSIAATRGGGQMVNLIDVLDEAARRARAVVDAKSPGLSEEERADIAEAVGLGAVKYSDLSQNPQTDIIFEWDKMLSMEGNTAPYMMYAHARLCSILAKAGDAERGEIVLGVPVERELATALLRFPEMVEVAVATSRPNLLCDYLYTVAQTVGRFYTLCPVLKPDVDPAAKASRLSLVASSAKVLSLGLGLLGIRAVERM